MSKYLHHLFFDPLNFFEQAARDLLIAIVVCSISSALLGAYMWYEVRKETKRRESEEKIYFKNLTSE